MVFRFPVEEGVRRYRHSSASHLGAIGSAVHHCVGIVDRAPWSVVRGPLTVDRVPSTVDRIKPKVTIQFLERLIPIETRIRKHSAVLGKQLGTASESIALNLGEGVRRCGGDKRRHYEMAAGSASEVTVALRIAVARRYVSAADFAEVDVLLDRVRAMLWRLTR